MAADLGLLAALLWGLADFLIRVAGRTVGVHRSMLYAQGLGAVCVGAWIVGSPTTRAILLQAPVEAWVAAVGAAPIGLIGTLALYRGLKVGRMGLVSPIAGAYGAVTAVLSLLGGEQIGHLGLAGLASTVAGTVLVAARPDRETARNEGRAGDRSGLISAGVACLCFGVQFWIQGRFAVPGLGAIVPVGVYYVAATLTLAAAALVRRPCLALSPSDALTVFGTGMVAVLGFAVISAGLATGKIALVTVLSSLQSAVSVGLACLFFRERLSPYGWLGVLLVTSGLAMVRAG